LLSQFHAREWDLRKNLYYVWDGKREGALLVRKPLCAQNRQDRNPK